MNEKRQNICYALCEYGVVLKLNCVIATCFTYVGRGGCFALLFCAGAAAGMGALPMDGSWANTMTAWMPSIFGRVSCTRQNDDVWCPVPGTTFLGSSLYFACFSLLTMRPAMLVWLIATLLLGHVMADLATEKRNSKIEGTWSSGAGNVMTGQNETGVAFFNPMRRHFTVPPTAGYSYSFTKDGHFEMAQFTYQTNPKDVHCFSASLVWQHGTYKYDGTNIYMSPYKGDGAIQTMGECLDPQVQMNYYAEKEVGANVTVYTDNDIVFYPDESMYVLQMHKFNGKPLPKMYLRYRPPRMMPTRSIFKQVIGAPG